MASTAQFTSFGPFFSAGALIGAPHIFHYAAGTTTLLNAYTDRAKSVTAAQPLVGDAGGVASAYFDGLYKIVVKSADETLTYYTWDNVDLTVDEPRLEGSAVWDPGALLPGQGATAPTITVTGAALGDYVLVSAPYDLQTMIARAYVSATNTVTLRLDRPVATLSGSATYNPGSLADGAGETSADITVTGAALGDAVVVNPPYELQGITVTGYVRAANAVVVRVQNESGGVIDLASGTWFVTVLPKPATIDLASGTWKVRVFAQ